MKAYVVLECGYEESEIIGVFSTEELASETKRLHEEFLDEEHTERIEWYKKNCPNRPVPSYLKVKTTETYVRTFEMDETYKRKQ
jgi:hypothetical protein